MYKLNISKHLDVGGYLNLDETRKANIIEYIYNDYVDKDTKIKVIVHEIFEDLIEKGFNSRNNIKLLFDADIDILPEIEKMFDMWDIDVETIK